MIDLELLREIVKDVRLHFGIALVTKTGLAQDNSVFRVQVSILPEQRPGIAMCAWDDPCSMSFPQVNDLVLIAMADGSSDAAYVVKTLTTLHELIPLYARTGHKVAYARPGKKFFLGSDTKTVIARPDKDGTEPLVLGQVLINGLTAMINALLNAPQIGQGPTGPVFLDPGVRTSLSSFVSTYLTTSSTNIVSQVAYTERGTS